MKLKHNNEDKQTNTELEVFDRFKEIVPYQIIFREKRNPPEPDILSKLDDGTSIAFELVQVIDKKAAYISNASSKLQKGLNDYFNNLPKEEKSIFESKYKNTSIYITINEEFDLCKKKYITKTIFDSLLSLESNFEGELEIPDVDNLILLIYIKRNCLVDSQFLVFSLNDEVKAVLNNIDKKFNNEKYKSDSNMELVAYYNLGQDSTFDCFKQEAIDLIKDKINESLFKRVWIYSIQQNKILYVYPEL